MTFGRVTAAALVLLAASAAELRGAKPHRRAVPLSELPPWAQEAARTPTPATDASGVVLYSETIVQPLVEGGVRVVRRLAVRALKRGALDRVDAFVLPYQAGDVKAELRGWTVAPDGTTATAPDPVLDRRDDPATDGFSIAVDDRVRTLMAANPVSGATFVSEASVVKSLDLGARVHHFGDAEWPVVLSRLRLEVPEGWGRAWSSTGLRRYACDEEERALTCEARDVPSLPRDEIRLPEEDSLSKAWVRWWSPDGSRGFRDWEAVGRWWEGLVASTASEVGGVAALAASLRPSSPAELGSAIERAFDVTSRDVRYVSIQLGIGGYRPMAPAKVLASKFGDCKGKTALLRAIFSSWGLRTIPLGVLTRPSGSVDPDVPSPAQFDHMVAGVVLPDGALADRWPVVDVDGVGRLLVLDGTARDWSPWTLPTMDQGTLALLVLPEGGRLVRLPHQPPEASTIERSLDAEIDPTGLLVRATLEERSADAAGSELRSDLSSTPDHERRLDQEAWLQARFPGSRLGSYTVEGLDRSDRPVLERSTIEGGWFAKSVGGMLIVSPGRAARGLYGRPLPAAAPWGLRTLPREERVDAAIRIPEGLVPEAVPPRIEVKGAGVEGSAEWSYAEGRLRYRRIARLTTTDVSAEEYPAFRESVRRFESADATAVVFVKATP